MAVWEKDLGIANETLSGSGIKIFPNPTHGELNFEFQGKRKYTISIYDVKGTLLDQFKTNTRRKTLKWKNNLTFTGVAFVHIYEGKELVTIRKVIFSK